jgi:hypothetical protein
MIFPASCLVVIRVFGLYHNLNSLYHWVIVLQQIQKQFFKREESVSKNNILAINNSHGNML